MSHQTFHTTFQTSKDADEDESRVIVSASFNGPSMVQYKLHIYFVNCVCNFFPTRTRSNRIFQLVYSINYVCKKTKLGRDQVAVK